MYLVFSIANNFGIMYLVFDSATYFCTSYLALQRIWYLVFYAAHYFRIMYLVLQRFWYFAFGVANMILVFGIYLWERSNENQEFVEKSVLNFVFGAQSMQTKINCIFVIKI